MVDVPKPHNLMLDNGSEVGLHGAYDSRLFNRPSRIDLASNIMRVLHMIVALQS